MWKSIRDYLMITLGNLLVAVGIYYFLVPNNLAAGGVSGLAMVIEAYVPSVPIGLLMLGMNVILFIIAFLLLGPGFGAKTIYCSLGLSATIWLLEKFLPISKPLTGDLFIELIIGIAISAIGMGIVFNQNASTGGTDIIAKILNKYFYIDIGKALLLSDFLITLAAAFTFDLRIGMYALLGVVINGLLIDNVIDGLNLCRQVVIISSKPEEIKKYILETLGRGATIYSAKGAYTDEDKEIITSIVSRKEFIRLKNLVKAIDDKAFMIVNNAHETLGEGFKDLND